ncbi:MAG: hypothetical protein IT439_07435 [Phycisphaerales bacterium]|nr:hypothetical protein [Phycisphaerales bacterium]
MIHPAPTTRIDPTLARGVVADASPDRVTIEFPNTSYRLDFSLTGPLRAAPGKRIIGIIRLDARRIDTVDTGGRFVEPVYGPVRRVQGTVLAIVADRVVVNAGMPIHCRPTDPRQKASDFSPGDFVGFDAMPGASFEERS